MYAEAGAADRLDFEEFDGVHEFRGEESSLFQEMALRYIKWTSKEIYDTVSELRFVLEQVARG
jgi:hypothetical protein